MLRDERQKWRRSDERKTSVGNEKIKLNFAGKGVPLANFFFAAHQIG